MTESPLTVSPTTTVEEATHLMLAHQISGLPVLEDGQLVGIITTSDVLQAFLEMTGSAAPGSIRIDLLDGEKGRDLAEAATLLKDIGGEVLGVGTYCEPQSAQAVFYVRLRGIESRTAVAALQHRGYTVLNVHEK
jgi:acetoin utilization protein AcuB